MKSFILIATCLFGTHAFGQIESVPKLKKNAQVAREKMRTELSSVANDPVDYVNPFVGTGAHGHTYPGASAPFGMMQLSPDTRYEGWDGCSGYHYSDSIIYGFSHTHLSGTGVPDYGDLLIVPQMGEAISDPGYRYEGGYGAAFRHDKETASPGYYAVTFNNGIETQLTVTERCGMHHYRFPEGNQKKFILLDLDHRDHLLLGDFEVSDQQTIQGVRVSQAWATEQHFYFYLQSKTPFIESKVIDAGGRHKLLLTYPANTTEITLKVGMSAVDKNGAKNNLLTEMPDWDFNVIKENVEQRWRDELSKITVTSSDRESVHTFYTALYHAFLNPNLFSDCDGRYRGRDKQIHQLPEGETQYTVFSLWDTYRGAHPLFTITQQKRTADFIKTFDRQYEEGGDLPVWELAGNETECMIGYHSVSVIADAYMKNIPGFSIDPFLESVVATSNFDEYGKTAFRTQGYIGVNDEPESVSKTLEYAYDDFCIYLILTKAKSEGKTVNTDLIETYRTRALQFVNCFDPQTGFMRGRRSGLWFSPFKPEEVNFNYTEANSWQYSLYAPHAIGILSDLLGGEAALEKWLDQLFSTPSELSGRHQVDITGLIGQYAHGNEPSHHMAYLYNYTDSPSKTADIVDSVLYHYYSNTPEGLSGNEDCGQMSSWYVLSSLGFYPVAPGSPHYDLGRPIFDRAVIRLENGKRLTIQYTNNSKRARYIHSVQQNGKKIERRFVKHSEIEQGGVWEITMSHLPNDSLLERAPTWGNLPETFTPVPYFEQETRVFDSELTLSLAAPLKGSNFVIYYTINGSDPREKGARVYKKPFTLTSNTEVKAVVWNKKAKRFSSVIVNQFIRKQQGVRLQLESEYANQYAAGGADALIDGITGGSEYRTGDWQGYAGTDIVANLQFDTPRLINELSVNCLEDMRSWIFLPEKVNFTIHYDDGTSETQTVTESLNRSERYDTKSVRTYSVPLNGKKVVNIKLHIVNPGKCPDWHPGVGGDTWLFADEIIFN